MKVRYPMVTIENIKRTELTDSEREVLTEDRKHSRVMGTGAHLDAWLAYGPGLQIRRRLAMQIAFVNKPEGRGYVQAYGQLLRDDNFDTNDKKLMAALTNVLWLTDNPEHVSLLREIRETMSPGERSRLNSPLAARQRVEKVLKARNGGSEESSRISPVAVLKRGLVEREHRIADLEEKLAAVEHRDGSLFDLKRDTADDIGRTIVATISASKVKAIIAALTNELKKPKPAG